MASAPEPHNAATIQKPAPVLLATHQPVRLQARADTAYSTDWTAEEQVALDATLEKYPGPRHSSLERYVRAAAGLPKKTARDVALRVKWLATSHATKRRLNEDAASKKRPRVQSIFAVQPKGAPPLGIPAPGVPAPGLPAAFPPPAQQQGMLQYADEQANANGGGPMAQLLEQNYQILNQYKQNMQQYKVHENTELLVRFRDNILTILSQMNSMSGLMQHMPPLPVRLNIELASNVLPKPGGYPAGDQPLFQVTGASYAITPAPFQASMKAAQVVPVSSAGQPKPASRSQGTKSSPLRSKSKSGSKARTTPSRSEDKSVKPAQGELRTSARRAAQKSQPAKPAEVRSSARLAAASDSAPSL